MKHIVIIGGNPYVVLAETNYEKDGVERFVDFDHAKDKEIIVAEFDKSKIEGIIFEDNNLED